MLLRIYDDNPNPRDIDKVVDTFNQGGLVIYPTDTIYGLGCGIIHQKSVEVICKIKNINPLKNNLSFICHDLSQVAEFTKPFDNNIYKLMRKHLPGPFTFILEASNNVPKLFKNHKKTIGVRIPDNKIILQIVESLGYPILSTSVLDEDEVIEYTTDPELIYEKYGHMVDIVINNGYGDNVPSTVVDCTGHEIKIIRQGKGILEY